MNRKACIRRLATDVIKANIHGGFFSLKFAAVDLAIIGVSILIVFGK
ncbi:hypothetical protein VC50_gp36 [Pseudomonas phage vB_PaeM_C1-14_Ab28]|uniref:Phage protein n=1 Tax=Pseudomonas phage Epa11 TaxID=2719569 RepID=A0A6G9LID7_9CAUD|nr:hypothetical protein VC50_gp36 [Pseudomonas phage vB_PaeM_C1-14_Ab28]QIQ64312.1 hypothetical protein Epa11_00089 [Pseudomonas phage Epa11]WPF70493.1 hypothetical protein [Pseudomonas phage BL1]